MLDVLNNTVDILKVLPNKAPDFQVFGNHFEAVSCLVPYF